MGLFVSETKPQPTTDSCHPNEAPKPMMKYSSVYVALACVLTTTAAAQSVAPDQPRDTFYWLNEQNKASTIMLAEQRIISSDLAATIAQSLTQVIAQGAEPGAARPTNYLPIEELLIEIGGPEVSRIHSGRSRQDLGVTNTRLYLRDALLDTFEELISARAALLDLAERHPADVLPFYTNGVQAQPTTVGHYLGGYVEAMTRGADRYQQAWGRLNLSPLGGAAGGTSSFPVDRARLAELLGFDGIVVNSFDSGQVAPQDLGVEIVSIAASGALTLSMLAADWTVQYADPRPWFQLQEGDQTGISSIMPQKRNPSGLTRLHATASTVIGEAVTYLIQSNNVMSGLADYKGGMPLQAIRSAGSLYRDFEALVEAFVFHPERALEEVDSDYSTTTELADILQRDADVPFRVGHHFASELVSFGRSNRRRPADIPFAEAQRIYTEASASFGIDDARLPLSQERFRESLTARNMTQSALPVGGPQAEQVARMLAAERERLQADREWLAATRAKLDAAAQKRDAGIAALIGNHE